MHSGRVQGLNGIENEHSTSCGSKTKIATSTITTNITPNFLGKFSAMKNDLLALQNLESFFSLKIDLNFGQLRCGGSNWFIHIYRREKKSIAY